MKGEGKLVKVGNEDELFERVSALVEESRRRVAKAVNTAMVYTYFGIGRYIVEYEQSGSYRAAYGKGVLERLSLRLTEKFGKGWSVETLTKSRKFYHVYEISSAPQTESKQGHKSSAVQTESLPDFSLSWNHYQILMRIENPDERRFYEIEAKRQNWEIPMDTLFRHLTTEMVDKVIRKRIFEMERSKRLHWVRYHLDPKKQDNMLLFSVQEREGVRTYYYDKDESYVIVLEPLRDGKSYYLLTAYYVRGKDAQRNKIEKKYQRRLNKVL